MMFSFQSGKKIFRQTTRVKPVYYLIQKQANNMTGMLQFEDPLLAARFAANHPWVNPVDPDMERKAFADHLFAFMKKRKTPIGRVPQLGHREVDLFLLYTEVARQGGLQHVIEGKNWKNVARVFNFPKTCTNAGFTLRIHYMKYLYAYERVHLFGLPDDGIDYTPKKKQGGKYELLFDDASPPNSPGGFSAPLTMSSPPSTPRVGDRPKPQSFSGATSLGQITPLHNPFMLTSHTRDYTRTPIPTQSSLLNKDNFLYKKIRQILLWGSESDKQVAINLLLVKSYEKGVDLTVSAIGLLDPLVDYLLQLYNTVTSDNTKNGNTRIERRERIFNLHQQSDKSKLVKTTQVLRNLVAIGANHKVLAENKKLIAFIFTRIIEDTTTLQAHSHDADQCSRLFIEYDNIALDQKEFTANLRDILAPCSRYFRGDELAEKALPLFVSFIKDDMTDIDNTRRNFAIEFFANFTAVPENAAMIHKHEELLQTLAHELSALLASHEELDIQGLAITSVMHLTANLSSATAANFCKVKNLLRHVTELLAEHAKEESDIALKAAAVIKNLASFADTKPFFAPLEEYLMRAILSDSDQDPDAMNETPGLLVDALKMILAS